jgi:hypothetical protein
MPTIFWQQLDVKRKWHHKFRAAISVARGTTPAEMQDRRAATRPSRPARDDFDAAINTCIWSTRPLSHLRHTFVRLSPCFFTYWSLCGPNDATKLNKPSCRWVDDIGQSQLLATSWRRNEKRGTTMQRFANDTTGNMI